MLNKNGSCSYTTLLNSVCAMKRLGVGSLARIFCVIYCMYISIQMEVPTKIQLALEICDSNEYTSLDPILSDIIWKSVADSMKDVSMYCLFM